MYKISEVLGWLLSIRLLFKNRLSVSILGLYAGAFSAVHFFQANNINSLIVKAMNESTFVILGKDFNEDGSCKGMIKTIDYIFISSNLVNAILCCNILGIGEHFDTDHCAVSVFSVFDNTTAANTALFSNEFVISKKCLDLDAMWNTVCKMVFLSANGVFKKKWFKSYNKMFTKESSRFHKLKVLVLKLAKASREVVSNSFFSLLKCWNSLDTEKASIIQAFVNSSADSGHIHSALFSIRKSYYVSKMAKSLRAEESSIQSAIEKRIENFVVNKGHIIHSVLEHLFQKVVLDHLVSNDSLIVDPVDTKIRAVSYNILDLWQYQYLLLNHVDDKTFFRVINVISYNDLVCVVKDLPDGKAAGLSSITNELWKYYNSSVLGMLLDLLNFCLVCESVFQLWKEKKTKVATKTPNLTVLEFCRAIYTQNQSDLELPEGCCPAESAFTYYINVRINYHIGKEEEPHDAKLGLYRKLSQYTTKEVVVIAATIVKIHREIEQYANENFPISTGNTREHANKTKENLKTNQESNQQKLETPAQTPKKTVTQSIKKQRIYSPEDKSYHFSPENKIQIPLGAASSSTSTPQTPRTPSYIDKIKQCNWGDIPITEGYLSLFQNPLFQPKFRTGFENHEEESESESEKETSEKTITRPVTGTSSQSRNQETRDQEKEPDIREVTFRIAQRNIIPPPLRPINPPAENGNEMTTPYIARLTDFSGEEEETDVHTWLREAQKAIQANNWNDQRAIQTLPFFLKGTADSWYQSLKTKLTSFAEFKNALLEYFSDPNAVIQLQNKFNTIKQNTGETVTQYLARFNQIRRQIEVIEQEYYTDHQVLNQFIRRLKSSILGRVRPAHPNSLPEAVTLARALESAKKEANHSQIVNIVMEENKTETLEKRVTQLGKELSKKIESYLILDPRKNTYQPPQRRSQEVSNSRNNCSSRQEFRTETRACHFCKHVGHLISQCRTRMMQEARENNYYAPPQMSRNQYTPIPHQYPTTYQNQRAYQQQPIIANPNWRPKARNQPMWNQNALVQRNPNRARTNQQTNSNYQNYQQTYLNIPENLIIGNNDGRNINITKNSSKLSQTIPPAVATEDSSLAAIFPFELEENEAMFSGAALDEKRPITAIYMEATVNNTPIKLILDSGSAGSIITLQLVNQLGFKVDRAATSQIITADGSTKLPYGEINSFPFEINGIVIPTKVLVMDATQYQALIENDWLTKANTTLDWTTQELLINYNGHQAKIPAICGHFQKPSANQRPTFKFEENPALLAIETYQLSWADDQRTGLPAIPKWTSKERSK
ncbi:hypothetical protein G9A89_017004 [Geosiphon pyriformis]|nr:hypothetical protein G9A89_017004 [Geosiphon pyriformis]